LGRGLDVVLLEDGMVKETWSRLGRSHLTDLLRDHRPSGVGIDAPPRAGLGLLRYEAERAALPVPPAPGTHLARRVAEYELSRRGIGSHQTHYDETRLFSWMTAGFETYAAGACRRCAAPGGSAREPAAPRLCECGCGGAVRRRFLPGHDRKLRSRLLRDLRAGQAASRELARLGWRDSIGM